MEAREQRIDSREQNRCQYRPYSGDKPGVEISAEGDFQSECADSQRGKGDQEGLVRVRPELKKIVTFKQLNLLSDNWPVTGQFDAIFCRNVMIYFDKATQGKILSRFAPLMKPDGLLFAGHSENFLYVTDAFKLRGKTVYELEPNRKTRPSSLSPLPRPV